MIDYKKGILIDEAECDEIKTKLTLNFFAEEWKKGALLWTSLKAGIKQRINTEKISTLKIPNPDNLIFFLDRQNKMYRTTFKKICEFIDETLWSYDAYIFDDKYKWIISITHEDISFISEAAKPPKPPRPPKTGRVKLNFSKCRYLSEIHQVLQDGFDFEYYGDNWDSLHECLRDYTKEDLRVDIIGLCDIPKKLEEALEPMKYVFRLIHKSLPNITFNYSNFDTSLKWE